MSDNRAQPDAPASEDARAPKKKRYVALMIAWGDSGWAARITEVAGEHTQILRPYRPSNSS
ncbi:MAG TPA: hypothetical protein VI260_17685 [Blastocatellia bacterium]|jgi:hypothetical protein